LKPLVQIIQPANKHAGNDKLSRNLTAKETKRLPKLVARN